MVRCSVSSDVCWSVSRNCFERVQFDVDKLKIYETWRAIAPEKREGIKLSLILVIETRLVSEEHSHRNCQFLCFYFLVDSDTPNVSFYIFHNESCAFDSHYAHLYNKLRHKSLTKKHILLDQDLYIIPLDEIFGLSHKTTPRTERRELRTNCGKFNHFKCESFK